MDIDEEDDFYAPDEPQTTTAPSAPAAAAPAPTKPDPNEELEEGEEEDEGGEMDEDDDSDVDIITERKDGSNPPPPAQSRYSEIRNIPQRSTSNDTAIKLAAPQTAKKDTGSDQRRQSGTDNLPPPVATSKINVHDIPTYKPVGKPLTQVNIDEDLAENDKPWRKPGTDLSDYFNYGFDEFTWALYAQKQEAIRGEYSQEAVAQTNKKMLEEMTNMMMMNAMGGQAGPGNPGAAGQMGAPTGPGGVPGAGAGGMMMPGMEGMTLTPEMQQMMQQYNMDPNQMGMAMFGDMQGGQGGGPGGQGGQGQNFGGGGFGGNQQAGYGGYEGMGGGGGGGGGRGGRGRGRRW